MKTRNAKAKSRAVKGAPSCQRTLGRSLYVVTIVPSGLMTQPPFSWVGISAAIKGRTLPLKSYCVRYELKAS